MLFLFLQWLFSCIYCSLCRYYRHLLWGKFARFNSWQKIKGSFYNCRENNFSYFFPSLLVCRHQIFVLDVCYVAVTRQQTLQWLVAFRLAKILLGYIVIAGVPASLLKFQFPVRVCLHIRPHPVFLEFLSHLWYNH